MADGHRTSLVVRVGGDSVHQLAQGLLHRQRLSQLADLPLRGSAHEQLDPQRAGDHRLHPGQPPVFPKIFQGLQHKQRLELIDILLHLPDHPLEGHPGGGQFPDFKGDEHLSPGGGA